MTFSYSTNLNRPAVPSTNPGRNLHGYGREQELFLRGRKRKKSECAPIQTANRPPESWPSQANRDRISIAMTRESGNQLPVFYRARKKNGLTHNHIPVFSHVRKERPIQAIPITMTRSRAVDCVRRAWGKRAGVASAVPSSSSSPRTATEIDTRKYSYDFTLKPFGTCSWRDAVPPGTETGDLPAIRSCLMDGQDIYLLLLRIVKSLIIYT